MRIDDFVPFALDTATIVPGMRAESERTIHAPVFEDFVKVIDVFAMFTIDAGAVPRSNYVHLRDLGQPRKRIYDIYASRSM